METFGLRKASVHKLFHVFSSTWKKYQPDSSSQPKSTGIRVLASPSKSHSSQEVSIILVHGFGSSTNSTWGGSHAFWPEWLTEWFCDEKGMDYVRICAFEYLANYQRTVPHNSLPVVIEDAASDLLSGMKTFYQRYGNVYT